MPTLTEARESLRAESTKALDVVQSTTLTPAEQREQLDKVEAEIKRWTNEVRDLEFVDAKRKELIGSESGNDAQPLATIEQRSWGQQFVESAPYKSLVQRGLKGGRWSTGDVELNEIDTKAAAAINPLATTGAGGALVATPTVVPGVLSQLFAPLTVVDLFPSSATSTPLIRYVVESAVTNSAATVAEGAPKPESTIAFDKFDETLHKIATFLAITDEMLEDWSQIRGYIDARLQLFVRQEEEDQVLRGDGSGTNVSGLLDRTGLQTEIVRGTAPSVAADNGMDAIYRQLTAIRVTSFVEPDAIVIDPLGWESIILAKNAQGAYYANGPFVGAQPATLWGKRVVVSPAMSANHALVGAFAQGAQLWRKGGLTVEASNSHADFFQRNLTALRAEERIGLAVYRPGGFGLVNLA